MKDEILHFLIWKIGKFSRFKKMKKTFICNLFKILSVSFSQLVADVACLKKAI